MLSSIINHAKFTLHGLELIEKTQFFKNMNPETFKLAKSNGIDIFIISESNARNLSEMKDIDYACAFRKGYDGHTRIYLIKEHFEGFDVSELDFCILHEIGHIIRDTQNELVADNFAIDVLSRRYDRLKAMHICRMAMLSIYGFDNNTKTFSNIPKGKYVHRRKWLSDAVKKIGVE